MVEGVRRLFVEVAAAALLAAACGAATEPSRPTGPLSVSGIVRDYQSNQGVAGVRVQFQGVITAVIVSATTDAGGRYTMMVPGPLEFTPWIGDQIVGTLAVTVPFRGDLFTNVGACVARYGIVSDERTRRPIAGAAVQFGREPVFTGPDGWYEAHRPDLGCMPLFGNTNFMQVTHPNYQPRDVLVGRGAQDVLRTDVQLSPLAR